MAAKHGSLGEFDLTKGDWKSYIERAKQYFAANDIADGGKQRAILLSSCGDASYRTIKDVLSPTAPGEASFKTIVDKMTKHLQPAPSEIVQRCRFNTRTRRPHESVAAYIAELKHLSEHCNFGDAARLKEMLRDRLVCGIENQKWQQRLLSEDGDLTYEKAQKLLLALEAAEKEVKDLSEEKAVHQVRTRTPKKPPRQEKKAEQSGCHRCGGSHDPAKCRFKHVECHYCHKKGHIAAVCRQKAKRQPQSSNRSRGSSRTSSTRPTNTIAEESDETLEYPMHCLRTITDRKPWSVELKIEGTPVRMEIDTGATLSIMSQATYDALWMTRDDSAPKIKRSFVLTLERNLMLLAQLTLMLNTSLRVSS